ncbi:MAG: DUF4325 domain-containing protein [Magnetococcales bacterium]|nr:DUF4325 domain-containing protein [Magnetococcales bacterium]
MQILKLPEYFSFRNQGIVDFDAVLSRFVWEFPDHELVVDLDTCRKANYQSLALLVPYIWKQKLLGKKLTIQSQFIKGTPGHMWSLMGARGWSQVLYNENENFRGDPFKPLIAIRNQRDFLLAMSSIGSYLKGFNIEYENTLRYIVSELLYNTIEHGPFSLANRTGHRVRTIPSIVQLTWYKDRNELHCVIADLGIGIKKHLEQTYPAFEDHASAIEYALKPQVSGTFGMNRPYDAKNNAGVGLFISSNIIRKLHADMYLLSGNGLVHVSPMDVTKRTLGFFWPGTVVLILLRLGHFSENLSLQRMMSEFREAAAKEGGNGPVNGVSNEYPIQFSNYFGRYAEDKQEAIQFRNRRLLPATREGKVVIFDFADVESAPHSFLNALLAEVVRELGIKAFKRLKFRNTTTAIRETIDFIIDENVPDSEGD